MQLFSETLNHIRARQILDCWLSKLVFNLSATLVALNCHANLAYQTPEEFIANNFPQGSSTETIWLTGELAERLKTIFGRKYHKLRLRYWHDAARSAWILDEIGKEKFITAGFIIEKGKIRNTTILAFRESRGWEIRFPFFTKQFEMAVLTEHNQLNKRIDNITGATLSVKAVERMAKAALLLDQWINQQHNS